MLYLVTPQHVFPGIVHNTLNYTAELNHKFYAWHARYVVLWPSPKDTEDMSGIYRNIYMRIINSLENLADIYVDAPEAKNAGCMIMTWKAMDEELAKKHIKNSLAHSDWLISSVNDIVKMKWGTDINQDASYYYRSFLRSWDEGTDRNVGAYPKINHYFFLYLKSFEDPRMEVFGTRLAENDRYQLLTDTITRSESREMGR